MATHPSQDKWDNYHSREKCDKPRLCLHKDGKASDSKGHFSINTKLSNVCTHIWSCTRGSQDILARVIKHFGATERTVIRLWKWGQQTSTGDFRQTIASLSRYTYKIDKWKMYWTALLVSLLRAFMQQGYSKLPKGNGSYNSAYVPSVNKAWHLLRIIISKECVSLPCD